MRRDLGALFLFRTSYLESKKEIAVHFVLKLLSVAGRMWRLRVYMSRPCFRHL